MPRVKKSCSLYIFLEKNQDPKMKLRVLTLNIWGIRYIAKLLDQRIQALINHLISPEADYDIIGLQEVSLGQEIYFCINFSILKVWSKKDYIYIRDQIKSVYKYSYYFLSGLIGSGCCIFSKHPIIGAYEHRYSLNGKKHIFQTTFTLQHVKQEGNE